LEGCAARIGTASASAAVRRLLLARIVRSEQPFDETSGMAAVRSLPLVLALLGATSCSTIQWVDRHGAVHLLGLGTVERVPADGGVITRTRTPGMSLRVVTAGPRYCVGWVETTFFQSAPAAGPRELLAIGDRVYGVAVDPGGAMVGIEQRFMVMEPDDREPVVQEIHYRSGRPSGEWLRRREGQ
jgi:hypothetical protein